MKYTLFNWMMSGWRIIFELLNKSNGYFFACSSIIHIHVFYSYSPTYLKRGSKVMINLTGVEFCTRTSENNCVRKGSECVGLP